MAERDKQNIIQTVKDYGNKLFGFIRSKVNSDADAEDLFQEVWYQFSSHTAIDTIEQVSGWLFAVARNKITDHYRKQKPKLSEEHRYDEEEGLPVKEILFAPANDPETAELKTIFWEALLAALDELPANQRQVFVWNELEDMTLQQIASREGVKLKTIISRKRYAVKHLRKKLQFLYDDFLND